MDDRLYIMAFLGDFCCLHYTSREGSTIHRERALVSASIIVTYTTMLILSIMDYFLLQMDADAGADR